MSHDAEKKMKNESHGNYILLAAVSRIQSLDAVGFYAIMLAKRMVCRTLLLVVLTPKDAANKRKKSLLDEKLKKIKKLGVLEAVVVNHRIASGSFTEEVASCLASLDSPLLVVGEGSNRHQRIRELKEIEENLANNKDWNHRDSHHFLMVTKRQQQKLLKTNGGDQYIIRQTFNKKGDEKTCAKRKK